MAEERTGGPASTKEANVLIVDDEAGTRMLLKAVVKELSVPCRVYEAVEADSALEIARTTRPDLVLLDIVLPGSTTSGVLVCQQLCRDPRTKVVIVSGKADRTIVETCLQLGAIAHVRKPFSVEGLRAQLDRWLAT